MSESADNPMLVCEDVVSGNVFDDPSCDGVLQAVDVSQLCPNDNYEDIPLSPTEELLPATEQLGDLIVNADNSLSLGKETLEDLMVPDTVSLDDDSGCSALNEKQPVGNGDEHAENLADEISQLFPINPEDMERLESALLSDQVPDMKKVVAPTPTAIPLQRGEVAGNITEDMLDEKFRQVLQDKEEYGPSSGKSSDELSDSDQSNQKLVVNEEKGSKPKLVKTQKNKALSKLKSYQELPQQQLIDSDKPVKVAAIKPRQVQTVVPEKKSYPKRENRRLPDRLKDSAEPTLFSSPDAMNRHSIEKKAQSIALPMEVFQVGMSTGKVTSANAPLTNTVGKDEQPEGADHRPSVRDAGGASVNSAGSKASKRIPKRKGSFFEVKGLSPKVTGKPAKRSKVKRTQQLLVKGEDDITEYESTENPEDSDGSSWNSEDDPDRLWCICRKPHNNRFMICCDRCAEWFHGHCVGVTKAMGKSMEDLGREWTCPSCKRKMPENSSTGKFSGKDVTQNTIPIDKPETAVKAEKRQTSAALGGDRHHDEGPIKNRKSGENFPDNLGPNYSRW